MFSRAKFESSPYINRFLSADTIVPGYANPQALNRYSYVLGNPLKYIDPSGHNPECGPDGVFCDNDPSNDDLYYPMQLPGPQPDPGGSGNPGDIRDTFSESEICEFMGCDLFDDIDLLEEGSIFHLSVCISDGTFELLYQTGGYSWQSSNNCGVYNGYSNIELDAPWDLMLDELNPLNPLPSEVIPPGSNFDFWGAVDQAIQYGAPTWGIPALQTSIGQFIDTMISPAVQFLVSRGAGFFVLPEHTNFMIPPIYQQ